MPLPSWEVAKEIADRLPGRSKEESKDEKCPECNQPMPEGDERDRRGR